MQFIFSDLLTTRNIIHCSVSPLFLCSCCVFEPQLLHCLLIPVVTCLIDRYTVGECCLTEETPPVLSKTSPPGRLLLLADRHAGRPRALGPLPQCGHQEELHSVTPASHFPQSRGSKRREVLASRHCPEANKRQVRCCRRLLTCLCLHHRQDLLFSHQ